MIDSLERLNQFIASQPPLAIALSGGVDSLTLAWSANLVRPTDTVMVHAVSPAVPPEATNLVKHYAKKGNWSLEIVDADEYNDPRYRNNPVNRCYFCKTNLYTRIQSATGLLIASGTNTDDLGDYRPGLQAAEQHHVIHPYVEADINKAEVRKIASLHGLNDVAVLPAQPCLASRVETGIQIDANDLTFINTMEVMLREHIGNGDIRCRVTLTGIKVEIDDALLAPLKRDNSEQLEQITKRARRLCEQHKRPFIGIDSYTRGSAFIHTNSSVVEHISLYDKNPV